MTSPIPFVRMCAALSLLAGCSHEAEIGPDLHAYEDAAVLDSRTANDAPDATPESDAAPRDGGHPDGAGGLPPLTATESCSQTYFYDAGATTVTYAEHEFAGMTAQQLAATRAIAHTVNVQAAYMPPGYSDLMATVLVRDGYVAVTCGPPGNQVYDSVTFVLPQ